MLEINVPQAGDVSADDHVAVEVEVPIDVDGQDLRDQEPMVMGREALELGEGGEAAVQQVTGEGCAVAGSDRSKGVRGLGEGVDRDKVHADRRRVVGCVEEALHRHRRVGEVGAAPCEGDVNRREILHTPLT